METIIAEATSNGLGNYMALANLTVVGALIIVFVVGAIWIITRGLPRGAERLDGILLRHENSLADSRREFLTALNTQTASRTDAAKAGHDAAMRIADNLHDLTEEVRRGHEQHSKQVPIVGMNHFPGPVW